MARQMARQHRIRFYTGFAMRYDIIQAEVGRLVCGVGGIDYIAVSVA